MSILNQDKSLILIIDIQEKLLNAVYNKEALTAKAAILAKAADILKIPVVITEQYPKGLGYTIPELKNNMHSSVFEKTSFSAIDETEVFDAIKKSKRSQIILFGIETHICVSQTANALVKKGYDVNIISDACGSRNEKEHYAGLDRIKSNGAKIITTEIALFEWLRTSKHQNFKEIQALIK